MKRELFEIWEDLYSPLGPLAAWKVQMVNYVASFPTQEAADSFVAKTKAFRETSKKTVK